MNSPPRRSDVPHLVTSYPPYQTKASLLPTNLEPIFNTRTVPLNGEAFRPSRVPRGGLPCPVGWRNDLTCGNQGSEICVSVLEFPPCD